MGSVMGGGKDWGVAISIAAAGSMLACVMVLTVWVNVDPSVGDWLIHGR